MPVLIFNIVLLTLGAVTCVALLLAALKYLRIDTSAQQDAIYLDCIERRLTQKPDSKKLIKEHATVEARYMKKLGTENWYPRKVVTLLVATALLTLLVAIFTMTGIAG